MKNILQDFSIIIAIILISSCQMFGQNYSPANLTAHPRKLELKILNNLQTNDVVKMDEALSAYPGKIISHSYGENKNKVFVVISDNVDPVDILQVLKMNGIKACYRDSDNGYISLEPDGHSTRKLYFKE